MRLTAVALLFIVTLLNHHLVTAGDSLVVDDNFSHIAFDEAATHYIDLDHNKQWQDFVTDQIELPEFTHELPTAQETLSTNWHRLKIKNNTDQDQLLYLTHFNPTVDYSDVYTINQQGQLTSQILAGEFRPVESRPINSRYLITPVTIPSQDTITLLTANRTVGWFNFPMRLSTGNDIIAYLEKLNLIHYLTYGAGIALLLYHLFVYAGLRENVYFYFSLQCAGGLFVFAYLDGFLFYPLSNFPQFYNALFIPSIYLPILCNALFYISFYQLFTIKSRFNKPFKLALYLCTAGIVLTPFVDTALLSLAYLLLSLYTAVLFVSANTYFAIIKRETDAMLMLIGVLIPMTINIVNIINLTFFFLDQFFLDALFRISLTTQFIAFALALSLRLNRLKRDKVSADFSALESATQMRANQQFIATISHEIRTPMNGVLGMSEMLSQTSLNEKQQYYNETISSSGKALLNIINDLLDFSKMEAGKLRINNQSFNIRDLIAESVEIFSLASNDKNLVFLSYIDPQVPDIIDSDPKRIQQVVFNYLSNAFKFTQRGSICIRVDYLSHQDPAGGQLTISVEDTGFGIPQDQQSIIFDSYSQVDDTNHRLYGGTGLGLTICRQLAELMGGTVGVESTPGVGSLFYFKCGIESNSVFAPPKPSGHFKHYIYCCDDQAARDAFASYSQAIGLEASIIDNPKDALGIQPGNQTHWVFNLYHQEPEELRTTLEGLAPSNQSKLTVLTAPRTGQIIAPPFIATQRPIAIGDIVNVFYEQAVSHSRQTPASLQQIDKTVSENCNVLVAEDNKTNTIVISKMLESLGYPFTTTIDGEEAVALWQQAPEKYQIILMDCHMPTLDGYQATEKIRALEQQRGLSPVTIVALTASALETDRNKCFEAGMTDFMSKPINLANLGGMIERYAVKER